MIGFVLERIENILGTGENAVFSGKIEERGILK